MSTRERFLVRYEDYAITLDVDREVLTVEKATLMNDFWSGNEDRLSAENGDVVRVMVRLFGVAAIRHMLADGGASFGSGQADTAGYWLKRVLREEHEGWYGPDELGITIVTADVYVPDFDDVSMEAA